MKKFAVILIGLLLIISSGCFGGNTKSEKVQLSSKYYNEGKYIEITKEELSELDDETYGLFIYNNYCNFQIPCEQIFEVTMKKHNIDFLSMPFEDFRETKYYKTVKYAPSLIIIKNGKILDYLKADSDADADIYQNSDKFEDWLSTRIYLEKED